MKTIQKIQVEIKEGKVTKNKVGEPKKVVDSVAEMLIDKTDNFINSKDELLDFVVEGNKKKVLTHKHSGWEEVSTPKKQSSKNSK